MCEQKTHIKVEQMSNFEKMFVLNSLKFNILYAANVLYASRPLWTPIEMKILRGETELRASVELFGPHLQGGGYEVFHMFGVMHMWSANVSEFEIGDIICIDTSVPFLERNIVDEWYKRIENRSPWKELHAEILEKHSAVGKSIEDKHLLGKRQTKARINACIEEEETHREEFRNDWREFRKRMRDESLLPEILRFSYSL